MIKWKGRKNMQQNAKESVSHTPYDDAFRTLLNECPKLMIPVVNEVFQQKYDNHESVEILNDKLYINQEDGRQEERITDSNFRIRGKRYHIECQSTQDRTMLYRLFEYDSQLALQDKDLEQNHLKVRFPRTAVLYLRDTANTPDTMQITICVEQSSCSYEIPVIKIRNYSLEDIFERNLLFLLPFHIFVYEKDFDLYESSEEKLADLQRIYETILERLAKQEQRGKIDSFTKQTIVAMSKNVIQSLTKKQKHVKERLGDIMGGKILNYEAKDILNKGKAIGIEEGMNKGREQSLLSLIQKKLAKGKSIEQIADEVEESVERVQELMEKLEG